MTHVPCGRHFEEFTTGETFTMAARTVTEGTVDRFAGLSGGVARSSPSTTA
jgi:acyl dehydratase